MVPKASPRSELDDSPSASQDERVDRLLLSAVVGRCQRSDRAAQRQLYEACHRMVYRLAARMVGTEEAADVSQQVFLQVFRRISQFKGRSQFKTWLYRLTVNESLQHLRRAQRRKFLPLAREPAVCDDEKRRVDQRDLLEHSLARIDVELRAIFLLREVDSLSYREIAETLDIPEGTVGSRLNRARRELRSIIDRTSDDEAADREVFLPGDHRILHRRVNLGTHLAGAGG